MVCGLHLLHTGVVLPEHWETVSVQLYPGDTPPPEDVRAFINFAPSRGTYPGVFDYKFVRSSIFPAVASCTYRLLLLRHRTIVRVHFHDPTWICETCTPARRAVYSYVTNRGRETSRRLMTPSIFFIICSINLVFVGEMTSNEQSHFEQRQR